MSMCVHCPYLYTSPIPHVLHSSISCVSCVKSETAAVLVVTQHGLLKHMQVREVEGEDVSDPDMLKAVQIAVRVNRSVRRIKIEGDYLRWTNVATAIIEGAAHNTTLMKVELETPEDRHTPQLQMVVDKTRQASPKLQLVVMARGE